MFIKNGDPQPVVEVLKKDQLSPEQKEAAEKALKDKNKKSEKN